VKYATNKTGGRRHALFLDGLVLRQPLASDSIKHIFVMQQIDLRQTGASFGQLPDKMCLS
jgi:hypothetical protein